MGGTFVTQLIGRSLRVAVDRVALGERHIIIDCDVIQADAGTRTAAITGSWIALKLASLRLLKQGILIKDPVKGQVAAVSVGLKDGVPLLDLDYSEDSRAEVDLNVVMDSYGHLLELQGTAEGKPFSRSELNHLLEIAEPGIKHLLAAQLSALQRQG